MVVGKCNSPRICRGSFVLHLLMRILIVMFTCLAGSIELHAQTDIVTPVADKIKQYINNKQADSIYFMAAPVFSKAISAGAWRQMAEKEIFILAPINAITPIYKNNLAGRFKVQTAHGVMSMLLVTNKNSLIEGLQFSPYTEDTLTAKPLTAAEIDNEKAAVLFENLYNDKQTDSLAGLMDSSFYKNTGLTDLTYKRIFESQLFQYGSIISRAFIKSVKGVSKYKCELSSGLMLQLFIQANEKQKITTWGMQPYKDDTAPKKTNFESDNKKLSIIDSVVDAVMRPYMLNINTVGACAGVYYKGNQYFYHYGETQRGNKTLPNNTTLFEIGSITKTFTSTLLADAVLRGKIKTDDLLIKYLPDSVAANTALAGITIKQLSNHTSGLPRLPDNFSIGNKDAADPYKEYDINLMMSALKVVKPLSPPGGKYAYSNFAPALLCIILQKVNKQTFEEMLINRIAKPMGLKNTHTFLLPANKDLAATTYNEQGKATNTWNFSAFAGAGSIISNIEDMLAYGVENLEMKNAGLRPKLQMAHAITFNEEPNIVALGWHYYKANTSKFNVLQHSGGTYGSLSHLAVLREKKLVVAVLTNNAQGGDAAGVNILQGLDAALK